MKRLAFALWLCAGVCALNAAPRKIAYEHGENIFVSDLVGAYGKKVARGALPNISPDGTRVAFNTESDAKNRPGPERHIAVVDLATGKTTVFKDIPSDNCFGPVWSPDGKQLAFMIMSEGKWQLGFVNADGSGFHFLNNAELKKDGLGGQTWSRDGKSIFCHDLDNLYQVDLDGKITNKWELAKILTDAGMNSGDNLSVSPDGKSLLMDVDTGSEHERKDWDGPQPAVEKFDLGAEHAVRVTGKDDFIWEPYWLNETEFLCVMQKEHEKEPSIYLASIDAKNPKIIIKHARTPSVSLGTP